MLVLSRKQGDTIRIGNDIVITVISSGDGGVRIGIDAPTDYKILRGELYENIKIQTLDAVSSSKQSLDVLSSLKSKKINRPNQ